MTNIISLVYARIELEGGKFTPPFLTKLENHQGKPSDETIWHVRLGVLQHNTKKSGGALKKTVLSTLARGVPH